MIRKRPRPQKALSTLPTDPWVLGPVITSAFERLNVGASFHVSATPLSHEEWYPIHAGPSPIVLEMKRGLDTRRWRYNLRGIRLAHRAKKPVLTSLLGFADFFVPFGHHDGAETTLVVGPFATSHPKVGDVMARWRDLGGRHARLADPGFVHYLNLVREVLTLEGPGVAELERLLTCFAALRSGEGDGQQFSAEVEKLMASLARTRSVERMWRAARALIDDTGEWGVTLDRGSWRRLGITRVPEVALVGLLHSRRPDADPVHELLRREELFRACTQFAQDRGEVIAGRLGDHGLVLLFSSGRGRVSIREVADKVSAIAKPLGLQLFFGSAGGKDPSTAGKCRAALGAAERALATGTELVQTKLGTEVSKSSLAVARRALRACLHENPALLVPTFQRYVEVASVRAGYALERVRAYLEAMFDDVVEVLEPGGVLDARSLNELRVRAELETAQAETVGELAEAYRRIVLGIAQALSSPEAARRDRSFERAIKYVRDHVAEPLSRAKVAKIAGFAEHYFSKRFHESEGVTFQAFVKGLRLERSKQMLRTTSLSVDQVAELSGFGTRVQFYRSFKRAVGITPSDFRARMT